jgi:hypothetical protein
MAFLAVKAKTMVKTKKGLPWVSFQTPQAGPFNRENRA